MPRDSQPLEIERIAPGIPVSDIKRGAEFYSSLFDLEKTFENGDPVGFVILKRGRAELHLTLKRNHKGGTHNVIHIIVGDADELYERCRQAGARIIKEIRNAPWGLRTFVFADPDGNRIDAGHRLPKA